MIDLKAEIERLEGLLAEKDKWPGKIARTSINLAPRLVEEVRRLESENIFLRLVKTRYEIFSEIEKQELRRILKEAP